MQLSVKDRLILLTTLPSEGDITTLRIVHDLRSSLSFSEEELATYSIKMEATGASWDDKAAAAKEIEIGPKALSIIIEELEKLNTNKKLTEDHLEIYERFVEDK